MKQALITGCTRGLGYELLSSYLRDGWTVYSVVRNITPLEGLAQEHKSRLIPICCDITDPDIHKRIQDALNASDADLSVLINNAGHGGKNEPSILEVDAAFLSGMIHTHCIGAISVSRAALPYIRKRPASIINVSSRLGSATRNANKEYAGLGFSYTYRIAKASQNMATLCMSQDTEFEGITVCAIHPGRLKTASGAFDADTKPSVAASRMKSKIDKLSEKDNGTYIDLEHGLIPW